MARRRLLGLSLLVATGAWSFTWSRRCLLASFWAWPAQAAAPGLSVEGASRPMPLIGYGTCCRPGARGEDRTERRLGSECQDLVEGVKAYLKAGGRLIDTAQIYQNHEDIAEVLGVGCGCWNGRRFGRAVCGERTYGSPPRFGSRVATASRTFSRLEDGLK